MCAARQHDVERLRPTADRWRTEGPSSQRQQNKDKVQVFFLYHEIFILSRGGKPGFFVGKVITVYSCEDSVFNIVATGDVFFHCYHDDSHELLHVA